jgi:AraC family transcriptional regulator, transcriptional activator FtrA
LFKRVGLDVSRSFPRYLEAQAGPYAPLMEWISENLSSEHGVETLAVRAGQSPRTFYRRFTAACGQTPAAFVKRLRLNRARLLLEAGETPKRVAVLCGFNTLDNLGRTFHEAFGLAPSVYRALHGRG